MGEAVLMSDLHKSKNKEILSKSLHGGFSPPTRPLLSNFLPDGAWKGRRCFIVGGGPSLRGFDFSQLKGELVIAVNRAFEKVDAAVMISQDERLWGWIETGELGEESKKRFDAFKGLKVWLNLHGFPFPEDICILESTKKREMCFSCQDGLPSASNSGLNALCLAVCLGASPIYLLGFDMKGEKGKAAWWHDGYIGDKWHDESIYKSAMIPNFELFAPAIKAERFRVINLNPDSALRCFEIGEFKDIKKRERPLITGCYTKDTEYEGEIKRLEKSLVRFGLEYYFEAVENLGNWRKNIHQKVKFVQRCLDKFECDIIQMDSDTEIKKFPELFDQFQEYDIAIYIKEFESFTHEGKRLTITDLTNVSVVYFKNNAKVKRFVEAWVKRDATLEDHIDDISFGETLKEFKDLKVLRLPHTYCHIFSRRIKEAPVIELHQASRRLKESIEFDNVKTKQPIFVAFYTKDTGYEEEIKKLIGDFKRFKLEYEIEEIENLGEWQRNVKYKAVLMKKILNKYPDRNLVYLDSDTRIWKVPVLFSNLDADIAMHYIDWSKYKESLSSHLQLNGAVVYLANNAKVRNFLDIWIHRNKMNPDMTDQKILEELLGQRTEEINMYNLPPEYCKIFDLMVEVTDPVIEQYQASRKFKEVINCPEDIREVEEAEREKYRSAWECGAETASINSKRIVNYIKHQKFPLRWEMIEFGCGTGFAVRRLREAGLKVIGSDITLEAVGEDKEGFLETPLWRMPFKNSQFDFSFSADVLEHIPPEMVDATIKEIYRVTKWKTFHAIAPFEHCNMGYVFHPSAHPIEWWEAKFKEIKNKKLDVGIMHRSQLSQYGEWGTTVGVEDLKKFLNFKKIAIIGNAQSMLEKEHPEIDRFSLVIRMNKGFPQGKEKYVGSRTDMLAVGVSPGMKEINEKFNPKCFVWINVKGNNPPPVGVNGFYLYPQEYWEDLCRILGSPQERR